MYYDYRPTVGVAEEDVIPIDSTVGLHPEMRPFKDAYDEGDLAIIHGVGYANSPRSHFRSMDIWHTCEPDTLGTEGWLGKVVRELDPNKENVVTAVSMGPSMFRALSVPGVPVACVDNLDSYGLMTNVEEAKQRERLLERYKRLYGPAVGSGPVMDFLGQTGLDALAGADILKIALSATSPAWSTPKRPSDASCEASPRYTWPTSAPASSTSTGQLRQPLQPGRDARQAPRRHVARRPGLLRRPACARRCRERHHAHLLRVRSPHLRQRLRHRPRRCRRGLHARRRRRGGQYSTYPPSSARTSNRATPSPTSTSEASTAPSSKTGSISTPTPSSAAHSKNPAS